MKKSSIFAVLMALSSFSQAYEMYGLKLGLKATNLPFTESIVYPAAVQNNPVSGQLGITVADTLTTDGKVLWTIDNNSGQDLQSLQAVTYIDIEIDQTQNTFFNETAALSSLTLPQTPTPINNYLPSAPTAWQIDEPGYYGGQLNIAYQALSLNNSNDLGTNADDIAVAFQHSVPLLKKGERLYIEARIGDQSTNGIQQSDPNSQQSYYLNSVIYTKAPPVVKIPPVVTITAPTTTSPADITDTTIKVTDDVGVLVADIVVQSTSTATYDDFTCQQISATEVNCTITITASGTLIVAATDSDNLSTEDSESYTITTANPLLPPVVTIDAPTITSDQNITDTTISVTDDVGVLVADIVVQSTSTATYDDFTCQQISTTEVNCTITITASGTLIVAATDSDNLSTEDSESYTISTITPTLVAPTITINAPTTTSDQNITDTTISVTDDVGVLVADVVVQSTSTATYNNFTCQQISTTEVNCTITITASGTLIVAATDSDNLSAEDSESYTISTITPTLVAPTITINAPTTSGDQNITDTKISITDDLGVLAANVVVAGTTTAGYSNFSCQQVTATQVDCSIEITASGDLVVSATDNDGLSASGKQSYIIANQPNNTEPQKIPTMTFLGLFILVIMLLLTITFRKRLGKTASFFMVAVLVTFFLLPQVSEANSNDYRGKDFWVSFLKNYNNAGVIKLFAASKESGTVTVEIKSIDYKEDFAIIGGLITEILVPDNALLSGAGMKFESGIHVSSDIDISLYGISQLQYTTDAFQAIPTNKLGNEYYLAAYTKTGSSPLEFAVIATEDNTAVEFEFNALSKLDGRDPVFKQILNKGDIYYFEYAVDDITGTKVITDKSVAVFSGNNCVYIPNNVPACDHIVEQIPDISRWGTDYLVAPLALRRAGDVFRVVAQSDDTEVYIDYAHKLTLTAGEFYEFERSEAFQLQSSKPTLLMQYSKGQKADRSSTDPFMLLVTPVNQYGNDYLISTPGGSFSDAKKGKNFANIIIHQSEKSSLLADGNPIDTSQFKAVGTTDYVYAQLPITDAQHEFKADIAFYLSIYGYADYESYGYPGGSAYLTNNINVLDDVCLSALTVRNKPGKVQAVWDKNTKASYQLTRSERFEGGYHELAALPSGSETFLDTTVSNQKNYFYRLTIFDDLGIPRCRSTRAVGYAPNFGKHYNLAPTVTSAPPKEVKIKQPFTYQFIVSDPENTALTYKILSAPDTTAKIDATGLLSWVPANTGEYIFALQATDAEGAKALQEFVVKVYDPNTPPEITSTPVLLGDSNTLYQYQVKATDSDGDALTYKVNTSANGLTIDENTGLVSWQVPVQSQGNYAVEVVVSDSYGALTRQRFKLFINKGLPPRFTSIRVTQGAVGEVYQYKASAEDPEGAKVKYYFPYGVPEGMTIDAQTGELVWQSPVVGKYTIVIAATDGVNSVEQRYVLTISEPGADAFTINSTPVNVGRAGVPYQYQVTTEHAANPPKYSINVGDHRLANFNIDENTGLITWDYPVQGGYQIEVLASDGKYMVKQRYSLRIDANTAVNTQPPEITSTPVTIHKIGTAYAYTISAQDPEGQRLTYTLVKGPGDAELRNQQLIWNTPTIGEHEIAIAVSDGKFTLEQRYILTVIEPVAANQPPKITSRPAGTSILPNQSFTYQVIATDADNDPLTYFISSNKALEGLSIDKNTGLVTFAGTDKISRYTLYVDVSDGKSITRQTFSLIVSIPNIEPRFKPFPGEFNLSVGDTFTHTFEATDPEGKTVTYFLDSDAPVGLTINSTTGLVTWPNLSVGKRSFTIIASDGVNLTKMRVTLNVGGITRHQPKITSTPITEGKQNTLYTYQVTATDSDEDTLQYSLLQSPSGMTIDNVSGLIRWTPSTNGVYPIIVAVSDGFNIVKQHYDLVIYTTSNNHPPVITSVAPSRVMAGNLYQYQLVVTDQESDPLTYRLQNAPASMTVDAGGLVRWQTQTTDTGQYQFVVLVSDGNYEVQQTVAITVRENKPIDSKLIKGLDWIKAQQQPDGSVTTDHSIATAYQTTDEAYRVARLLGKPFTDISVQRFLADATLYTTEDFARSVLYRLENNGDYNNQLAKLFNRFRDTGYADLADEQLVSIVDTAYALLAQAKTQKNNAQIDKAIGYLLAQQQNDGSFNLPDNQANYYVTSLVLRALWQYKDNYNLADVVNRAKNYLAQQYNGRHQNWELAHALLTLYEVIPDKATLTSKVEALRNKQMASGYWRVSSPYRPDVFSTALAIQAIYLFDQ